MTTEDEHEIELPLRVDLLEALLEALDQAQDVSALCNDSPLIDVLLGSLESDVSPSEDEGDEVLKNQLLLVKVHVLLKLLLKVKVQGLLIQVSSESFQSSLNALFAQMEKSLARDMAALRNDIATIILHVATEVKDLQKDFGPFGLKIGTFVFENSLGSDCPLFPLHSRPEDVQLLTIFVHLLNIALLGHPRAAYIAESCCLVESGIALLIGPCPLLDTVSSDDGILNSCSELLQTLTKLCPANFAQKEGVGAMLDYIQVFVNSARAGCQGTVNLKIMNIFLNNLRTLVVHRKILDYWNENDGMTILVDCLEELSHSRYEMDSVISNLLLTLASLSCQNDIQQRLFLEANGVKILLRLLNRQIYAPPHKRHSDSIMGTSLAECIWRSLTSCTSSLEVWLGFEGMFRLLDFLEQTQSRPCQLTLLSALLDLCEYPRCLDQVLYWKRRNSKSLDGQGIPGVVIGEDVGSYHECQDTSLAALLCELWREEESLLQVERQDGLIGNVQSPLLSDLGRESKQEGVVTLDLTCSMRPKIFLLAKKIVEETNTEATLYGGLSIKNQVTMELIINFLDLKRAELWREIKESVKECPLVDTDVVTLERYAMISTNKALTVLDTQQFLLCRDQETQLAKERHLHLLIRHSTLQGHLRAVTDAEERARTSSYQLLVDKRLWQRTQLAKARREYGPFKPGSRLHLTSTKPVNVTEWDGRVKGVDSEEAGFEEDGVGPWEEMEGEGQGEGYSDFILLQSPALLLPPNPTGMQKSLDESPTLSPLEGYYEVNPQVLAKAITAALHEEKKWNWKSDEDAWMLRTKWKSSWY